MKKVRQLAGFISPDKKDLAEIDYLDQLTDEERHWFYRQIDNDYKALFYGDGKDLIINRAEQKKLAREKKKRQRDLYGQCNTMDDSQSQPTLAPRTPQRCKPKPPAALPVKRYTKEEIEELKKTYKPKK